MSSNAPVKKLRIGYVTATIWANEGTNSKFYSVEISRTFKDDKGELQNTSSLGHGDLANARELLHLAGDWIMTQ